MTLEEQGEMIKHREYPRVSEIDSQMGEIFTLLSMVQNNELANRLEKVEREIQNTKIKDTKKGKGVLLGKIAQKAIHINSILALIDKFKEQYPFLKSIINPSQKYLIDNWDKILPFMSDMDKFRPV